MLLQAGISNLSRGIPSFKLTVQEELSVSTEVLFRKKISMKNNSKKKTHDMTHSLHESKAAVIKPSCFSLPVLLRPKCPSPRKNFELLLSREKKTTLHAEGNNAYLFLNSCFDT